MLRRALTLLSLIGLLLNVGLWGVSYFGAVIYWGDSGWLLDAWRGGLWIRIEQAATGGADTSIALVTWRSFADRAHWWPAFHRGTGVFILPLWMPTLIFGTVLCLCRPLGRRRKRKKLGLCVKCGYDLRASKDRCPECGAGFSN